MTPRSRSLHALLCASSGLLLAACSEAPDEGATAATGAAPAFSQGAPDMQRAPGGPGAPGAQPQSPLAKLIASGAPDEAAVTVNGEAITNDDLRRAVSAATGTPPGSLPPQQMAQFADEFGDQLLQAMVDEKLLQQAVAEVDHEVSEDEIDAELAAFRRRHVPPEVDLEAELIKGGSSLAELRERIANDLKKQKMVDAKYAIEAPDEQELRAFYESNLNGFTDPEKVSARHILIQTAETDDEATRAAKQAEAYELRALLTDGETEFGALALEHSDCPSSKDGGSLGTFERDQMVPQFDAVAFELEPGVISDVVETQFGYHVIEVTAKQPEAVQDFEEVREQISLYLHEQARREALARYAEELRGDAEVEYAAELGKG